MGGYFTRHLQVLVGSLGKLTAAPLGSFATILVVGITLALPAALHLLVKNALQASGGWQQAQDFSVYLKMSVDIDEARELAHVLEGRGDIAAVVLQDADTALTEFAALSGFGDAIAALDNNPLPHRFDVRPASGLSVSEIEALRLDLAAMPTSEVVQLDTEWVARLQAGLAVAQRMILIAGAAFAVGLLVIIGNTIRLDIQNRRDEIEIMQLIGASDAFIRRPFLYTGFWYGAGGGIVAIGLLAVMLTLLTGPVSRLAGTYGSGWALAWFNWQEAGIVIGMGVLLGLLGAWSATNRHMRRIEPK
ncbi:MAG: permease-like cell division protein FtsX [Pseudomonadota bacterium]